MKNKNNFLPLLMMFKKIVFKYFLYAVILRNVQTESFSIAQACSWFLMLWPVGWIQESKSCLSTINSNGHAYDIVYHCQTPGNAKLQTTWSSAWLDFELHGHLATQLKGNTACSCPPRALVMSARAGAGPFMRPTEVFSSGSRQFYHLLCKTQSASQHSFH